MSGSGACRDDWDRGFDKDGDYERPSQPAEDERVKDADSLLQRLVETPAGERIRMKCGAADLRSVITDLLSLLPVQTAQPEDDGWVTFGRIKEDVENETRTFERIPVQPAASTSTDELRCEHGVLQSMECLSCTEEYVATNAFTGRVVDLSQHGEPTRNQLDEIKARVADGYDAIFKQKDWSGVVHAMLGDLHFLLTFFREATAAASTEARDERKTDDA